VAAEKTGNLPATLFKLGGHAWRISAFLGWVVI
jgi:hypothetical protein